MRDSEAAAAITLLVVAPVALIPAFCVRLVRNGCGVVPRSWQRHRLCRTLATRSRLGTNGAPSRPGRGMACRSRLTS